MYIVKVLKRRDASSVVVAIIVAMALYQLLNVVTAGLSGRLAGLADGQYIGFSFPGAGWKGQYLQPVIYAVLQVIALEILLRLYVWGQNLMIVPAKRGKK